jgi:hypothetical protein
LVAMAREIDSVVACLSSRGQFETKQTRGFIFPDFAGDPKRLTSQRRARAIAGRP